MIPAEPRQTAPRYAEVEMDVQQASVRMGWHTINLFHPDLYALDMVASVLSEGRSSRMVRRVVEQERLATEIFAYSLTPNYMSGTFGVLFQTPADKLDRTLEVVKEEVERIRKGPVSQEELDRARVQVVSRYQLALQEVANQAASVGANTLGTGDPRFSLKYVEEIQSVTPELVVAAARKYLDPHGLTIAVVRPRGTGTRKSADGRAASAAVEIRREVLENGLTLLVKRTPGVGPVGIQAFSYGGLRAEPDGKNGVSFLTGRLLTRGTASRSANDIASQVDAVGAQIQSRSGNNSIGLSLTLGRGKDDLPFAAELVADIFQNSTFPEEEFNKDKQHAIMRASRQDEEWQSEIYYLMRRELYGSHPYAKPVEGSTTTLPGVLREDVLAFAKKWIRPDGIVLAIAGDVEIESTLALFRRALAGWKAGEGAFTPPSPPELSWAKQGLGKNRFVFKENQKQQAVLCFAFPGPGYFDLKDRAAMMVLDAFTSGLRLPSGWFHSALRGGDRSLVYFIHLAVFGGLDPGAVYVYTQTEPKLLKTVHDLMLEQVEKLRRGEFTDEELEIGRAMALLTTAYYGQKIGDVAADVALSQLYGGTYDRLEKYQEAIRAVTREDVKRVVDRYLKHMLVLVSGSPEVKKVVDEVGISR
jgi:zinc protease